MKVRIVKPLAGSGYFTNNVLEISPGQLESLEIHNVVEVLDGTGNPSPGVMQESSKAGQRKKTVKTAKP